MIDLLLQRWHTSFGDAAPEVVVRAPGRVNIIGEHTDYNEGWVLPGAMSRSLYVLLSPSSQGSHHWIAYDLDEEFQQHNFGSDTTEWLPWTRYIEGAIRFYAPDTGTLRILIGGDLPVGAGISSSSALVCGVLYALQMMTGRKETREELALLGSRVEREVIGVQGGIMDQSAIMLCRAGHVMLLDCRTRETRHIRADLPGYRWILINTKVKHQLIDSDYNLRAAECGQAVTVLQTRYPEVSALRDVTREMLDAVRLPEVLYQRALFVLEENERVHQMVDALSRQDAAVAGQLLHSSHRGLRDRYEVSCLELDVIADFANRYPGVAGARMMGGGFGGCVICLLREEVYASFAPECIAMYTDQFGFAPEVIAFELGDGAERIEGLGA